MIWAIVRSIWSRSQATRTIRFALYDRRTGILLTGDMVYPWRLYLSDFPAFRQSIHRLALFTNGKLIAHVLGNHIEQTSTPYLEYPIGKMYQPEEVGRATQDKDKAEVWK